MLQHAHNPVDWLPWGDEAFERAQAEDKPIFLSIGYSTCHWCHVMAHESFEDDEVAKLLNEAFVSIKVDREERPDVDQIYMTVCQMMTGSGGWPLTIMMTPDREPFFAGTYFPKESRFGRIGMLELIPRVASIWNSERTEISETTQKVGLALNQLELSPSEGVLNTEILDRAYQQLEREFDVEFGGFGRAPKFPTPHRLTLLTRYWARRGEGHALYMARETLNSMAAGGIRDHLGGGFHRYSTDSNWLVPHFEKMLYDQALLVIACCEVYQATGDEYIAEIAREILHYVERDMTSPEGGFYSAEDADSEGVEGKFYVWHKSEIDELLGADSELFCRVWGVNEDGNFLEEATGERTGANILHLPRDLSAVTESEGLPIDELGAKLEAARKVLFAQREKRVHPHKDDKVLTDWNGLMIAAFAIAARALDDKNYANVAVRASDFVERKLVDSEDALLHRYRDGEASIDGFLDDYAFYIWGLLELYESTFNVSYLARAAELNSQLLRDFWDSDTGGFYFTRATSEDLIVRMKESYDGALPSGNSVAMNNLIRLSHLTGETALEEKALKLAQALGQRVEQAPAAHAQLLLGIDLALSSPAEIVVVGDRDKSDTSEMIARLRGEYIPNKVVLLVDSHKRDEIEGLAPFVKGMELKNSHATAYVCVNHACDLPTDDPNHMIELLKARF